MPNTQDGPTSPLFVSLRLKGNLPLSRLADVGISEEMAKALEHAPSGACVCWGVPFEIGDVVAIVDEIVSVALDAVQARWLVFMHTSDLRPIEPRADGFISPVRGQGQLGEHAADYVVLYADGTEERVAICRRHQLGAFQRRWGENCFQAVAHSKPRPVRAAHEQLIDGWGWSQTRVSTADSGPWVNWLWAWENPHPDKAMVGIRFEPVSGIVVLSAISAGSTSSSSIGTLGTTPLRWRTRRKAVLALPPGAEFNGELDERGLLQQVQLDMGQVISATPRLVYPNNAWTETYNNQIPERSGTEVLIEYTPT